MNIWIGCLMMITGEWTEADCTSSIKGKVQVKSPAEMHRWSSADLRTSHWRVMKFSMRQGVRRNSTDSQYRPCVSSEKSELWLHVELSGSCDVTPWQTEFCPNHSAAGGPPLRCIHCPIKGQVKKSCCMSAWSLLIHSALDEIKFTLLPKAVLRHTVICLRQIKTYMFTRFYLNDLNLYKFVWSRQESMKPCYF